MMMQERKRIYQMFKELSPREYMYFPKGTLDPGKPGKFSTTEIVHILTAMAVLTIAFSFAFSPIYRFRFEVFLEYVPISFLGILTAFFVHELSHKFMAQKLGLWSEFRMYPFGLVLAFFLALFTGFVFAAPGAVMFRGESREFETGRIAVAGPLANILIAVVAYGLYHFVFFEVSVVGKIMGFIALVNALLAAFNLLPFGPLDGVKVIRWNGIVWSVLFAGSIVVLLLLFYGGILLPRFF
jgi:Zn-dependent protease